MKRVRCGSGLGDSIYLRAVAERLAKTEDRVIALSDFPQLFAGTGIEVERFRRDRCDVIAHYSSRKECIGTNQWEDVCINAKIEPLPMRINWQITNRVLVRDLKEMAAGRPIIMVNGGRAPMGRVDGYAKEMLPKRRAFDVALAAMEGSFTVEVGQGNDLYPLTADVDLHDRTTPADLMDIASISSGLVGQCSFMIPLAESLDKPLLVIWAAAGLESQIPFIRLCTPQKILSKASSRWVMDNWSDEQISEAARAFRDVL